jgi:hypothetical protein
MDGALPVFVLGTDEAGYGPNLGPLCIAATAWKLPEGAAADGLYERLTEVVCCQLDDESGAKLAIADSKRLYKAGATLQHLERGVLVALACLDRLPTCWRELWRAVDAGAAEQIDGCPWHDGFDEPLPLSAVLDEVRLTCTAFSSGCRQVDVALQDMQATALFPAAFNKAVKGAGNKAEVLSLATLQLARRVLEALPAGAAVVFSDKHGGRNCYAALLQHVFPEELVLVRFESAALGCYQVRHQGRQIEFRFQPKGEQHLPTALASMTAKYLRELAMRPFNVFWQQHVPDLRPTAGYYNDAVRFFGDIAPARRKLKIAPKLLWRDR